MILFLPPVAGSSIGVNMKSGKSRLDFVLFLALFLFGFGAVENSVEKTIPVPKGYQRIKTEKNSFAEWMRTLPVKPAGASILAYTGEKLPDTFYKIFGIIDIPLLSKRDIEQCADWAYRFWYEYQRETGQRENLWLSDYPGNKITFEKWKSEQKGKDPTLSEFFIWTCDHANSYSQKMGLYEVKEERQLKPGDLMVQNQKGGVGHVSILFDVCENEAGGRLYLIGFGFMPAQECHIEEAPADLGQEGWFTLDGYRQYLKQHLDFGKPELRSFVPPK
jgi:hypothetical protein